MLVKLNPTPVMKLEKNLFFSSQDTLGSRPTSDKVHFQNKPVIMGLLINSLDEEEPSYQEMKNIIDCATKNGHIADIIYAPRCLLEVNSKSGTDILYEGKSIKNANFDVIIPVFAPVKEDPNYAKASRVLQHMEVMGLSCLASAQSLRIMQDKLLTQQVLSKHRIPTPTTFYATNPTTFLDSMYKKPSHWKRLRQLVNRALRRPNYNPIVFKELEGNNGLGVFLTETDKEAKNFLRLSDNLGGNILAQEYLEEAKGKSIRVMIMGDRVVRATLHENLDTDEFRSNIVANPAKSRSSSIELTSEEIQLAIRAARAVDANMTGLDMLRTKNGPMILELHGFPELADAQDVENLVELAVQEGQKYASNRFHITS